MINFRLILLDRMRINHDSYNLFQESVKGTLHRKQKMSMYFVHRDVIFQEISWSQEILEILPCTAE